MKKVFNVMLVTFIAIVLGGCATVDNHESSNARKELSTKGITFDAKTFIKQAAEGKLDVVKLFVEAGMDPDIRSNETALTAACYYNHPKVVTYLIQNGASVNYGTYYTDPIISAVRGGSYDIVDFLIKHGADVNALGYDKSTPLYVAAEMGKPEITELLIKNGADVGYIQPWTGMTPLAMCAKSPYGNKATIEQLVKGGANVNYKTPTGMSVIGWSLLRQKFDCLEYLLANGASANDGYPSDYASRAILGAMAWGNPDAVKILINHGISVNAKAFGQIPLAIWCAKNYLESMAILLVDLGADPKITYQGETLLDYAIANREEGLVKKLEPNFDLTRIEGQIVDPNITDRQTQIQNIMGGEYYKAQHTTTVDQAVNQAVQTNEAVGSAARKQLKDNSQAVIAPKGQGNIAEEKAIAGSLQHAKEGQNDALDKGYDYPVDQEKLEKEIDAEIKKIEAKYSTESSAPDADKAYEEAQTYQPVTTPVPANERNVYSGKGNVPIEKATPTYVDTTYQAENGGFEAAKKPTGSTHITPMDRNKELLPEAAQVINEKPDPSTK
jgi:ankyrin repeat protein